jgi:TPR repeat protein
MELSRVDEAYDEKMVAFEIGCNDGSGDALPCHQVGEYLSLVKDDFERSAKVYAKNCEKKGYAPSCFNLGRLYMTGKGVPQSDKEATGLFHKACKDGHLMGCYHEGVMLYSSVDRKDNSIEDTAKSPEIAMKDKTQALKLFDHACKEGYFDSCYFAGTHYIGKKEAARDPKKAQEYFTRGCDANHGPSCYNLAVMYKNGDIGVPKDEAQFEKYKKITNELVAPGIRTA